MSQTETNYEQEGRWGPLLVTKTPPKGSFTLSKTQGASIIYIKYHKAQLQRDHSNTDNFCHKISQGVSWKFERDETASPENCQNFVKIMPPCFFLTANCTAGCFSVQHCHRQHFKEFERDEIAPLRFVSVWLRCNCACDFYKHLPNYQAQTTTSWYLNVPIPWQP